MVLSCCNCAVSQDALDNRIIYTQAIQIRCQAPSETVPTMPRNPSTLEHILHVPLIASVQVERVPGRVCEDRTRHRIAALPTMCIKPLGELWNDRNRSF